MRLVRRWAVGVSEFVVRRASPRAKEWAEGLAHEVEFVEGDTANSRTRPSMPPWASNTGVPIREAILVR